MKKIFIAIILFVCTIFTFAQDYTNEQETLRKEIRSYLSHQGLNPENQSDGLKFKSEGSNFYIEIDKDKKNPMYLRLCRYVKFDEKITREKAIKNLTSYNVRFGVKVSCQEKNIVVSSEMFLTNSEEFTYIFSDILSQVKSACAKVTE